MKKYYFIDFDSVKKLYVKKESFDCKTYIYIFYTNSVHAKNIDLDVLQVMNKEAKRVEFISVPDEKHLLGKYLCGKLGLILGEHGVNDNNQYIIVSPKDSFDGFVKFIQNEGHNIIRKSNFDKEIPVASKPKPKEEKAKKATKVPETVHTPVKKQPKNNSKTESKPEIKLEKGKAEQTKTEQVKIDQSKVDQVKVDQGKVDQGKAEQIKEAPKAPVEKKKAEKKENKNEPKIVTEPEVKKETADPKPIAEEIKQPAVSNSDQEKLDQAISSVIEGKEETVPVPAAVSPYDHLIKKIYHELTVHKNDNGNKYNGKVKKDVAKLVCDELDQAKDLAPIYTKLKDRYMVTYSGIYTLVRKCVLALYPETKDYIIEKEEIPEKDPVQENPASKGKEEAVEKKETMEKEEAVDKEEPAMNTVVEEVPEIKESEAVPEKEEIVEVIPEVQEEPEKETVQVESQPEEIPEEKIQEEAPQEIVQEEPVSNEDEYSTIRTALKDLIETPEEEEAIIDIVKESKNVPANKQKLQIYTSLSKLLGRNRGSAIHKVIKQLL